MLDLNTIDHVDNLVIRPPDYLDMERYTEIKALIFSQLRDLDDLGKNLLDDINESKIKDMIYTDIIDYVRENYLNLIDKDYVLNRKQLRTTGNLLYRFLCVDGFNIILPKILEQLNIQEIGHFDKMLYHNRFDKNYLKRLITKNLSDVVNNLLKLQKIDLKISEDQQYKDLINTFGNYLEFIDFSDCEKLTTNYLTPLINKSFAKLLWRTLSPVN